MKYLWLLFGVFFQFSLSAQEEGYKVDLHLDNAQSDKVFLAYFYGDNQYVADTAFKTSENLFEFSGSEKLGKGVYMFVLPPENTFFQILIGDDQHFKITADANNITPTISIEGSEDNYVFYDYLKYLDSARKVKTDLQEKIQHAETDTEKEKLEEDIVDLDRGVLHLQDEIMEKHPESLSKMMIASSREPQIPKYDDEDEKVRQKKSYRYYYNHFFDNLDLKNEAILRTPFIHKKVMTFFDQYTPQAPDSLNKSIDLFMGKLEEGTDVYRYFLVKLLNKYANPKMVGQDAVYVHIAQNYYGKGKAPWIDEDKLTEILDNAERFSYTLIGKPAPNIELYDIDAKKKFKILDVEARYTVLIFWSYACSHCEEVMPTLPEIAEKIDDESIKIVNVCTKADDPCGEFLDENNIRHVGINSLPVSSYGRLYDVRSTPKIFIINESGKIASKGIGFSQIPEVIELLKKEDLSSVN